MKTMTENIISESTITPILTKAFNGFSKSVSMAVENSIKKVLDDVVIKSAAKTVTLSSIRNNQNYRQAVIQSVEEAARARHKMTFAELSKKLPNEADKLVSEVDGILRKDLDKSAKAQGKTISSDVKSSEKVLQKTQTSNAAGKATKEDLKNASKNWEKNVKLQSKSADAKRVLSGMSPLTRKQVDKILQQAKTSTTTGSKVSAGVKTGGKKTVQLPVSAGGGLFKLTKEQLSKLSGNVTRVVVAKGAVKSLIVLGVSASVVYLIYQALYPNNTIILEDENGNDLDFGGGDWAPCVKDLIDNKSGTIMSNKDGDTYVLVTKTGNKEYDDVGGLKFYSNGRVLTSDNSKRGSWSCAGGITTIKEMKDLNEQGGNMAADVDIMIDLLDFPVSQSDLFTARTLLKKYADSGKGKEFLNLYQKAGLGGGSLGKSLDYIYTVQAASVQAKEDMRALIQKIESGKTSSGGGEKGGSKGMSGINITWDSDKESEDGGKKEGGGGSKGGDENKVVFTPCDKLPLYFGCKGSLVKKIQVCLGMEAKYQTGNLGIKTKAALEDWATRNKSPMVVGIYDNPSVAPGTGLEFGVSEKNYNTIVKQCEGGQGGSSTSGDTTSKTATTVTNTSTTTPTTTTTTPTTTTATTPTTTTATGESPNELFNRLVKEKLLVGRFNGRRWVYKGPDLSAEDRAKLETVTKKMGFRVSRDNFDYKKGDKIVFKRNREEDTTTPAGMTQEPTK